MYKFVLVIVAVFVFHTAAFAQATDNTMMKSDKSAVDSGAMMKSDSDKPSDGTMMVSDADKKMAADPMDASAYNLKGLGKQVMAFTTLGAAEKLAKTQTVILNFAATWCPDCQATYKDIKANSAMLPSNVVILYVNYDKAKDLKKRYGITMQHTFVLIGSKGEKQKVWSGTTTLADIVAKATAM